MVTRPKSASPSKASSAASRYTNREISWLAFNYRVFEEAMNERHPLLERVKFAGIFSSNLDEFFMIRVSGLREQIEAGLATRAPDGMTPAEEMAAIRRVLGPQLDEYQRYVAQALIPGLGSEGIRVTNYDELSPDQKNVVERYFNEEVFPVCTPLALDPGHPFPLISNLSLNLAVVLEDPEGGQRFARVKVPSVLPRLVLVPAPTGNGSRETLTFTWLEEVLAANLPRLFPGMHILEVHPFRVIRDADIEIQELEAGDLLETVGAMLRQRRFGEVVALQVNASMSDRVRSLLLQNLDLAADDVYVLDGRLGLDDLMELYRLDRPDLKDRPFVPRVPATLRGASDPFAVIRQGDVLLHHPFDSFSTVVDFIKGAAVDPGVLAIKQTLYRVGSQSPIVEALREAAVRGKQVAVLVELKARFDEENNIEWARMLERAGVHVTYGLIGLKTHCKLALVVRQERDGLRRYVHIGTGNYNPATARLYTDLGLLTADPAIGADVSEVFNYITGYSRQTEYRKLLVAPVNVRRGLRERIEREIGHHERTGDGHLFFKMNALVDFDLIESLYRAASAGVRVDLNVRGICCLRPELPELGGRIRVFSIVGRFLEHSRIYYFHNGGEPEVFIGSADVMPRNLDHRVEVLAPIQSRPLRDAVINDILLTYLNDNVQSRDLVADGSWVRRGPATGQPPLDAQAALIARATSDPDPGLQSGGPEAAVMGKFDWRDT